ncbi:MAG: hypothetical protein HY744_19795 [Deltaproteobacteria bacterium]|nr:hypothetical protein [Deltaproteobacteria bacterium]
MRALGRVTGLLVLAACAVAWADCALIAGIEEAEVWSADAGAAGGGGPGCVVDECPGVDTDCQKRACVGGICRIENAAKDTSCAGQANDKVCDGEGNCVECNGEKDCTGDKLCSKNVCVPPPCKNQKLDGDESDVDCGGAACARCANDRKCNDTTDCDSGFCLTGGGGSGGSAAGICAACAEHADCQDAEYCNADGRCVDKLANGGTCKVFGKAQCASGFCADEICCDKPCHGGCGVCSKKLGASNNGTCTPLSNDTECRAKADLCDAVEKCDGFSTDCPADSVLAASTECRPAAGACDVAEKCDGLSAACAKDGLKAGIECRAAAGPCDAAEVCDGKSGDCPKDCLIPYKKPSTDDKCAPYLCDGQQASCPTTCANPEHCVCDFTCIAGHCVPGGAGGGCH